MTLKPLVLAASLLCLSASVRAELPSRFELLAATHTSTVIQTLEASRNPDDWWLAAQLLSFNPPMQTSQAALEARIAMLKQRSLDAGSDDPRVLREQLSEAFPSSHPLAITPEAMAELRATLIRVDADNIETWLALLPTQPSADDQPKVDAYLAHAATAVKFDSGFATSMRTVTAAYAAVPAPDGMATADLPASLRESGVSANSLPVIAGFAYAVAFAGGEYSTLARWCHPDNKHLSRDVCAQVAEKLSTSGDTLIARMFGFRIAETLAANPAHLQSILDKRRTFDWRYEQSTALTTAQEQQGHVVADPRWQEPGATEISVMEAALEAAGIPMEPPVDFISKRNRDGA
jgi:hypothetical protein